jgi:hypothetical protein
MRLRRRRGAFVAFVDSSTEETILKVECDANEVDLVSFHLYDSLGRLVSDSGPSSFPHGLVIHDADGELLLNVPSTRDESISYRLYSSKGILLTCSDGLRTQIYGGVRVDGNSQLPGRPPAATGAPTKESIA